MVHHIHRRTAYVFWGALSVPLEQLQLLEGQDMALVCPDELLEGSIWSDRLGCDRPPGRWPARGDAAGPPQRQGAVGRPSGRMLLTAAPGLRRTRTR